MCKLCSKVFSEEGVSLEEAREICRRHNYLIKSEERLGIVAYDRNMTKVVIPITRKEE